MTLKELREKRAKLIKDSRALLEAAQAEKRAMNDDESKAYDLLFNEATTLGAQISQEERQREVERELEETAGENEERSRVEAGGDPGAGRESRDLVMESFRSFLQTGEISGDGAPEFRALSAGVDVEGGYLVPPEQFVNLLIKALDDEVILRELATVIPMTNAASIGAPSLDSDPDDADWTTELSTGTDDTGMQFGKRVMRPHPMAKRIKISNQLLISAALPVESLVVMRMAYKFGITQEKAYMTGNGDKKPLGIFTASNDGIPVGRDISADNATTKPTYDGLINAKYSLKGGYLSNATWIFHRDVVKEIAKLKDGAGQYIWTESMRDDQPDRLLGRPVMMSEYSPNTLTTGQYVGIIGDFKNYWILDSLQFQMQRLVELYAEKNQIGFIGRFQGDGAPVLAEAFARVKLG